MSTTINKLPTDQTIEKFIITTESEQTQLAMGDRRVKTANEVNIARESTDVIFTPFFQFVLSEYGIHSS